MQFRYGADQMRYKQIQKQGGLTKGTLLYIGKHYEIDITDSETKSKAYLGETAIIVDTKKHSSDVTQFEIGFMHRDHLGSATAILNEKGQIKETRSFDPFGKPKDGQLKSKLESALRSSITNRGFTDHEHLDDAQLIHMNGRAYDYNLGRFMSVDPFIQEPGNSQSLNPYSYIMNNPLAGTDPSGYKSKPKRRVTDSRSICRRSPSTCSKKGKGKGSGKKDKEKEDSNGNDLGYAINLNGEGKEVEEIGERLEAAGFELISSENHEDGTTDATYFIETGEEISSTGGTDSAGSSLPFTSAGASSAQTWANFAVDADINGNMSWHLHLMGGLASLWTPDTSVDTTFTLFGGGILSGTGRALSYASAKMVGTAQTTRTIGHAFLDTWNGHAVYKE